MVENHAIGPSASRCPGRRGGSGEQAGPRVFALVGSAAGGRGSTGGAIGGGRTVQGERLSEAREIRKMATATRSWAARANPSCLRGGASHERRNLGREASATGGGAGPSRGELGGSLQ